MLVLDAVHDLTGGRRAQYYLLVANLYHSCEMYKYLNSFFSHPEYITRYNTAGGHVHTLISSLEKEGTKKKCSLFPVIL